MRKHMRSLLLAFALLFTVISLLPSASAAGFSDAIAANFGTTYSNTITSTTTERYYKLTLAGSGRVSVSYSADFSSYVYLFDESGNRLTYDWVSCSSTTGQGSLETTYDLTKGTYYFSVKRSDSNGRFNVRFTFTSANESFVETGSGTNNTIPNANAVSFGKTYKGQIAMNDEVDIYRVTLASSGRVKYTINTSMNAYTYLYNESGTRLDYDYISYSSTSGQGTLTRNYDLTKGTYYISITRYSSTDTGTYSFNLTFTSANESFVETDSGTNNTIPNASAVSFGKTYKGQIAMNDEVDIYRVTLASSGRVKYTINTSMNAYTYLYNESGTRLDYDYISYSSNSGQGTLTRNYDLTKGTYYISVSRYSGTDTGTYSFNLTFTSANESFAESGSGTNNTIPNANTILFGKSYNGQIAMNDEVDMYRMTLSASRQVYFDLTSGMSVYFYLYDSNGSQLDSYYAYYNTSSGCAQLSESVYLDKGTYYISIKRYSSTDTGCYNLVVTSNAAPSITAQPKSVAVASGAKATFRVTASNGLYYQWQYKKVGESGWTNWSGKTSPTVTCTAGAANNGCQYRCVVRNHVSSVTSSVAVLTTKIPPTIVTQPKDTSVAQGSTATFKVVASGTGLSYQWQYKKVGQSSWTNWSGKTAATVTCTAGVSNNGCLYRCVVKNASGSVTSNAAKLTTLSTVPVITAQPKSVGVANGETATFKVVASGTGLSYQWQYKKVGQSSWTNWSGKTAATVTCTAGTSNNGCQYRCVVKNAKGSVTSSVAVLTTVFNAPRITTQPKNTSVKKGSTATFKVTASGEALSYQWQYKKVGESSWTNWSGKTAATVTCTAGASNNGCLYRCVVKNALGTVISSTAKLTTLNP